MVTIEVLYRLGRRLRFDALLMLAGISLGVLAARGVVGVVAGLDGVVLAGLGARSWATGLQKRHSVLDPTKVKRP